MFNSIKFNFTFDSITEQFLGIKEINIKHIIHITPIDRVNEKLKEPDTKLRIKLVDGQIFDVTMDTDELKKYLKKSFIYFDRTYDSVTEHGLGDKYVNLEHIIHITPIDREKEKTRIQTTNFRIKLSDLNSIDVTYFDNTNIF